MIKNPIGILALSKREIVRFLAVSSQTILPPLVSSVLFMYIFGMAMGRRMDWAGNGLSYFGFLVPGLMTMHLISSAYENTSSSLFIARWHNHIQEVLLAPLSYFEIVLGLLAGGVARGVIVCSGVYLVSLLFSPTIILHPFLLLYFILTIAVIFSCAGMMGALWAEDFGMLNLWNVYVIIPLVFLGGVFQPISMLPEVARTLSAFNPMFYLVNGIRYAVTGVTDIPVIPCALLSLTWAGGFFFLTVHLFRIGYKLRT